MNPTVEKISSIRATSTTSRPLLASPIVTLPTIAPLPHWICLLGVLVAFAGFFTANPDLTAGAVVILFACIALLWRHGEPPVLLFACAMQWLQAAGIIFYADAYGMSVTQAGEGLPLEQATWLSLLAVLFVAMGMRIALIRAVRSKQVNLTAAAQNVSIPNAFIFYVATFLIAAVAAVAAWSVPALTQVIYAFATLKWVAVFALAYTVIEQRSGYGFLWTMVFLEFGTGVLGYFSSFKSVFFVLLVVVLSSPKALSGRRLVLTAISAAVLFTTGIVWSAIKAEYREFLNQGSDLQVVTVSAQESAEKLGELVSEFSWDRVGQGLEAMVLRVSYVQFFGLTLMNVPENVPYEHGALWFGAVKHVFTPRLLFPEKAEISDSERTTYYTGVQVAGAEQGTSIGIGYVGESYIDFGPVFMFVPIFLLGMFYGLVYRVFALRTRYVVLGMSIAVAILIFNAYTIETSNVKLVGGTVVVALVIGLIYLFFARVLMGWLEKPQST